MKKIIIPIIVVSITFFTIIGVKVNRHLYSPRTVWVTALFYLDENQDIFDFAYSSPDKIITPSSIRIKYHYTTGYADPFLFVDGEYLYLFCEREIFDANGVICAFRTKDLKRWETLGDVLVEDYHLSYPNVFHQDNKYYMLPEISQSKQIRLYTSETFPFEWKLSRTIGDGKKWVDNDIFKFNDNWYLIGSNWKPEVPEKMCIYKSSCFDSLSTQSDTLPCYIYEKEKLRSGGSVFEYNGNIYRPAQKCDNYYGENIGIFKITSLSDNGYSEEFIKYMNSREYKWSEKGGHHFNNVIFNGKRVVVMDGKIKDSWINNRTRKFFKETTDNSL